MKRRELTPEVQKLLDEANKEDEAKKKLDGRDEAFYSNKNRLVELEKENQQY